jgi:hypothetical protein
MKEEQKQRLVAALRAMEAEGPENLQIFVRNPSPKFPDIPEAEARGHVSLLVSSREPCGAAEKFSSLLRCWDNIKDGSEGGLNGWTKGVRRNSRERRNLIYEKLGLTEADRATVDQTIPFLPVEEPLIISKKPEAWTRPLPTGVDSYYWNKYQEYLRKKRGFSDEALLNLENTLQEILLCLSEPDRTEAYSSRGIVVGYVQSGKTANFTGLIARAADAGYRLIIILAGTWNILRNQTQRRIDKELLGRQLVLNDKAYSHRPEDWEDFLDHGFQPEERGIYAWHRITGPVQDYRSGGPNAAYLELRPELNGKKPYDRDVLKKMPVKLLVIKKHHGIIRNLTHDLARIDPLILQVPALVIDDESDQAGLNTINNLGRGSGDEIQRNAVNKSIVNLLKKLPRAQYIGYTATPYANAFVNPADEADLFPKDFIISLPRPKGYMGISDFFDPDRDYRDLEKDDFSLNEIAFIRRVENPVGSDDEDIKKALCLFVLSGAVKMYRKSQNPGCVKTDHHTMLVHISSKTLNHEQTADKIRTLWEACRFNSPHGKQVLKQIYDQDVVPVSREQSGGSPMPENFEALIPFLSETTAKILHGEDLVLVLNSKSNEPAPDFNAAPVWKIIVGGNKLSRGYTIEGLTVSYYRRVSATGDSLMQMGRWFGFREGYRDLVRVFVGVNEGRRRPVDLVESFRETCMMEEKFRDEIRRYARQEDGQRILPKDIPPLIEVFGNLPPTSKKKMFNAIITNKNFGGQWSQPTLVAATDSGICHNQALLQKTLESGNKLFQSSLLGGIRNDGGTDKLPYHGFEVSGVQFVSFLEQYRWLESKFQKNKRPSSIQLQIEFLRSAKHGINSWLVLLPQTVKGESHGKPFEIIRGLSTDVRERNWAEEGEAKGRLQQVGEPSHRRLAKWLCKIEPSKGCFIRRPLTKSQEQFQDAHRGILLAYAVRPGDNKKGPAIIGYEVLYPENDLKIRIGFSVIDRSKAEDIIISS